MVLPNGVPEQPVSGRWSLRRTAVNKQRRSLGRKSATDRFRLKPPFGCCFPNDLVWSVLAVPVGKVEEAV